MTRYVQRKDGEGWSIPSGTIYRLACCSCGLVHDVVLTDGGTVEMPGRVGIAVRVNKRATAQRRRRIKA